MTYLGERDQASLRVLVAFIPQELQEARLPPEMRKFHVCTIFDALMTWSHKPPIVLSPSPLETSDHPFFGKT